MYIARAQPIQYLRCIFAGKLPGTKGYDSVARPAGQLNLGPVGLGMLLTAGYLGDAKTFYCASHNVSSSLDEQKITLIGNSRADYRWTYACSQGQWKTAGGFDAATAMTGNWGAAVTPWEYQPWGHYAFGGRAVFSSYAYRNMPVLTLYSGTQDLSGMLGVTLRGGKMRVAYAKPFVEQSLNAPAFKTQKLLAGRAIVSDMFGKATWNDSSCSPINNPGEGLLHHRDGYNVLYGDWSAKWYGDPQQRLIYWPNNATECYRNDTYSSVTTDWGHWGSPSYYDQISVYATQYASAQHVEGSTGVWHMFDVNAGTDADSQP